MKACFTYVPHFPFTQLHFFAGNAQVGKDACKNWKNTCDLYANNETSGRGLRLLEFASLSDLKLANTFGPHKASRRWTFLSYLSRGLADRWGTTVDFTTSFLHSSRFSTFRSMMFHSRLVHSLMLSTHRFLCLPLRLPPWTVPCRIVLASPDDRVMCPNHFSLRLFTVVKRSSYGPMVFPILTFTSSLVMWSLYEIPRSLRKHLISNACILLSMSAVMVHVSYAYKNMDMARERISLILELMAMFLSFQMTFSLVTAAVVWAILDGTSGLDPSSDTIAPRYLRRRTELSIRLWTLHFAGAGNRQSTRVPCRIHRKLYVW